MKTNSILRMCVSCGEHKLLFPVTARYMYTAAISTQRLPRDNLLEGLVLMPERTELNGAPVLQIFVCKFN